MHVSAEGLTVDNHSRNGKKERRHRSEEVEGHRPQG